MNEIYNTIPVIKNNNRSRFELIIDGFTGFIDYKERENVISLIHTEVPAELSGKGVATALIEKTLHYLEDNHYILVPLCPLVFAYIKKNPDWARIVRDDFKSKFVS